MTMNSLLRKTLLLVLLLLIGVGGFVFVRQKQQKPTQTNNVGQQTAEQKQSEPPTFNKTQYSLSDPTSLWVIANKNRPLPLDYEPSDLVKPAVRLNAQKTSRENSIRAAAADALEKMLKDAEMNGFMLMLGSGYRSSGLQSTYYNSYVARDGQAAADRYSARPGTSEHQTGWAADVARVDRKCYLETCFADTDEGKWIAANAHKYGFIIRYLDGKEAITGYMYEPWHLRYVGQDLAQQIYESNQTLEEFFDLL